MHLILNISLNLKQILENFYKSIIDITLPQPHFVRDYSDKDFVIMEALLYFVP